MEFLNALVENYTEGSGEKSGRWFKPIEFENGISLSIQASYLHSCSPKLTIPLENYKTMEVAVKYNCSFVDVKNISPSFNRDYHLSDYFDGSVYFNVPVDVIEGLVNTISGLSESELLELDLSNYYGQLMVMKEDDKYYFTLDSYDSTDMLEISEELYSMIKKEFGYIR